MKIDDYIGKTYNHVNLERVKVISREEKSRTKLIVQVLDKGPGWDKFSKSFKGVKIGNAWMRGKNKEYKSEHIVHKNTLK